MPNVPHPTDATYEDRKVVSVGVGLGAIPVPTWRRIGCQNAQMSLEIGSSVLFCYPNRTRNILGFVAGVVGALSDGIVYHSGAILWSIWRHLAAW